jgi:hypothetical protein
MNRNHFFIAAGLSLAALVPAVASAHTDFAIGFNVGGAPVYAAPAPVEYCPPPVAVYGDDYWRWRHWQQERAWREHEWREHEWRERREHEWREHEGWHD